MLLSLAFLPPETPREKARRPPPPRPDPCRDRRRRRRRAGLRDADPRPRLSADLRLPPGAVETRRGRHQRLVNTIIVDFRGYDTFGEIIVLSIAALVIFALSETLLASAAVTQRLATLPRREIRRPPPDDAVVATRLLLPMAMMVGTYIYLRGHNLPGGGFVAGLVFAIAWLLQYFASGYDWSHARQRIDTTP